VNDLFRRAESILDIASTEGADSAGTVIVLDRAGQLRVLNPEGWTLPALVAEFGAREVYVVNKFAQTITVEGWSPSDSCTIGRQLNRNALAALRQLNPAACYAERSQVTPQLAR
jgi:hypothetical protein